MPALHNLTLCAAACEGACTAEHECGPSRDTRGELKKRSLGVYSSCNTACKPQSEMTFKVLFMSSTGCTQSFPSRVLSPTMNWHRQEWPQSRARACLCVHACVTLCLCLWGHGNQGLQVVSQLMFPFSPSCNRQMLSHSPHLQTAVSHTHAHTHARIHSLTLRRTWHCQILLDASIKRQSLCFVSTAVVVWLNSSILSSSINRACEIREMGAVFAAQNIFMRLLMMLLSKLRERTPHASHVLHALHFLEQPYMR